MTITGYYVHYRCHVCGGIHRTGRRDAPGGASLHSDSPTRTDAPLGRLSHPCGPVCIGARRCQVRHHP